MRFRHAIAIAAALCAAPPAMHVRAADGAAAQSSGGWKQEFDAICARTQDAMALPSDELRSLIARCEKLSPAIERLGESERKVYGKRLQGCRSLFAFVLESRHGS